MVVIHLFHSMFLTVTVHTNKRKVRCLIPRSRMSDRHHIFCKKLAILLLSRGYADQPRRNNIELPPINNQDVNRSDYNNSATNLHRPRNIELAPINNPDVTLSDNHNPDSNNSDNSHPENNNVSTPIPPSLPSLDSINLPRPPVNLPQDRTRQPNSTSEREDIAENGRLEDQDYFEQGADALENHPVRDIPTRFLAEYIEYTGELVTELALSGDAGDEPMRLQYLERYVEMSAEMSRREAVAAEQAETSTVDGSEITTSHNGNSTAGDNNVEIFDEEEEK